MSHRPSLSYNDDPASLASATTSPAAAAPSTAPTQPYPSTTGARTSSANAKADQIAHRIFVKLVNVVADARTGSANNNSSAGASPYPTSPGGATSPTSPYDISPEDGRRGAGASSSSSARSPGGGAAGQRKEKEAKADKWFNLETPDFEQYKSTLQTYKSISTLSCPVQPLVVSVLLAVPSATSTGIDVAGPTASGAGTGRAAPKVLVHHFPQPGSSNSDIRGGGTENERITRVTPTPQYILLETHTLSFSPPASFSPTSSREREAVELPQVYKQAISLFRSIYTLLRILPTTQLQRRLRRTRSGSAGYLGLGGYGINGGAGNGLGIEVKISVGPPELDDDIAGFDAPYSQPRESLASESISFPPILTPIGSFSVRTQYRKHTHYALESLESLLSRTHFLSPSPSERGFSQHDEASSSAAERGRGDAAANVNLGQGFTPTLASALTRERERQRRDSTPSYANSNIGSTAHSSPTRSPLPLPLPLPIPERGGPLVDTHGHARPFPIRADLELSSSTRATPGSGSGSVPISMPIRHQHHLSQGGGGGSGISPPSNSSSLSSSPNPHSVAQRVRRISALGSVSSDHNYTAGVGGGGGGGVGGASNSSPRFGFLHGRDPADLPFAVGLGSGRTSGQLGRASTTSGRESVASNAGGGMVGSERIRERKESLLGGSTSSNDAARVPTPSHGRRPSINSIHPFKSATVSSSPSSASFRGPSMLSQAAQAQGNPSPSPSSSNPFVPLTPNTPATASNPAVTAAPVVSSPFSPVAEERERERERTTSTSTSSPKRPPLAIPAHPHSPDRPSPSGRYASSFGARPTSFATTAAGTGGLSSGSSGPPIRRMPSSSNEFLSMPSEDDDISAFVKAIDSRAPLRGGLAAGSDRDDDGVDFPRSGPSSSSDTNLSPNANAKMPSPSSSSLHRRGTSISNPPSPLGRASTDYYNQYRQQQQQHTSPSSSNSNTNNHTSSGSNATATAPAAANPNPGMFRSRADVDEQLRRMTESFSAGFGSLEGGLRSRRLRTESAASALSGGSRAASNGGDRERSRRSPISGSVVPEETAPNNLSSSSLFAMAGGRRSYDSGEQIVGRMDEDVVRPPPLASAPTSPIAGGSAAAARRRQQDVKDALEDAPFARPSKDH